MNLRKNKFFKKLKADLWGNLTTKSKNSKYIKHFQESILKRFYTKFKRNQVYKLKLTRDLIQVFNIEGSKTLSQRKTYFRAGRRTFYGYVLREKQSIRRFSPELKESLFKKYFNSSGYTSDFLERLESRLDRVLLRILSNSPFQIRQWLNHGFVLVNSVSKPSHYLASEGDCISILKPHNELVISESRPLPSYLLVDYRVHRALYIQKPTINDFLFQFDSNIDTVVQFYKGKRS